MAGHSQFKNIMHRKGRQDAQKSKLFGKLAREITVAAKLGTPDPAMNPRLRAAIIAARQENMPKDNIERAVKKAIGSDGENYDEIRYEGYGPGGVAVIVEALTDNRNRAASDIRSFFTKSGGNLGETGSVAFMFDRTGIIEYDRSVASDDAMLDAAIEAGADDVVSERRRPRDLCLDRRAIAKSPRRWKPSSASPQGRADLEAAEHHRGRRRDRREAVEADGSVERARRRPERLRQFRGVGRADGEDGRVRPLAARLGPPVRASVLFMFRSPRSSRYHWPMTSLPIRSPFASSASTPACAAPAGA